MEDTYSDFVKSIQQSLREGNTQEALNSFRDSSNASEVKNNSWDLIPIICAFLTTEHEKQNFKVFKCCEILLDIITENSNAEEVLLQFIEEIEESTDDTKFLTLLKPLRKIMCRISKKRLNSLAWCFNCVQTYLNTCEVPDNINLVGKEKLVLDSSEDIQRINKLYSEVLPFYDTFIEDLDTKSEDVEQRKKVICKFLVQLLGKPLVYLDMEIFNEIKSKARILAENLVSKVFKVNSDPFSIVDMRFNPVNNELVRPNSLGTASLFYLIYSQEICIETVPKVYDSVYFFQNSLHLVTVLLDENQQICAEKGLALAAALLQRVYSIKLMYFLLDSEDHCKFCKALENVMIYNQAEHIRKTALEVYKIYIDSFEIRGFYLLVYNLMSSLNHSGLKGFTITQYKDKLVQEFLNNENDVSTYFKGPKLVRLLWKFCHLPENEESDLIDLSDQIMATLNLLRYLVLRDKNNVTQVRDYFPLLYEMYLNRLRRAIDLSRAHYELKIKETEEGTDGKNEFQTTVSVAGQNLLEMPKDEKLKVLYAASTAFDVMDSLLSRVVECIEANER